MKQMKKEQNIWIEILPEIIDIAKTYDITISIGATFRPASVIDACKEAQEEKKQKDRLSYAQCYKKKG